MDAQNLIDRFDRWVSKPETGSLNQQRRTREFAFELRDALDEALSQDFLRVSEEQSLDHDFVNTPEEKAELEKLILIGVDITRPLEEQSQGAQLAYWCWVRDHAIGKLSELKT